MQPESLKYESLFVSLPSGQRLHLRQIIRSDQESTTGPVIWCLHGAIENGKIFYSDSGKGLACFLAQAGYQVYVCDLGGRGQSTPVISRQTRYSQTETILNELPAIHTYLQAKHPQAPLFWLAHSWGGVLFFAHLARLGKIPPHLAGVLCLGTKRQVKVLNWDRLIQIEGVWKRFAYLLTAIYGYLPARKWKLGSDSESRHSHHQSVCWVKPGPWRDPEDQFDYEKALKELDLPPALFLTGVADTCLGHAQDVMTFMAELHHPTAEFKLVGKNQGFLHDYDHINLLTHHDAPQDHFIQLLNWLEQQEKRWQQMRSNAVI
ncbi:MAG: alpha/beta fold hydrolase [Candidatus Sericytochromatia bacterium]